MLDLSSVKRQIDVMVADRAGRQGLQFRQKLTTALAALEAWSGRVDELAVKVDESRTSWLVAGIREEPGSARGVPPRPPGISVAATDGSQIFPDRHEVSSCFLINIGYVLLHYGSGERPLLSSKPRLFYKEDELLDTWAERWVSVNRELIGFRRSLLEHTELAELSAAALEEGHKTVALADGSLIPWSLEGTPTDFRNAYLEKLLEAFDQLRERRIPVAGYISRPRSRDVVNSLRIGLCPLEAADCERCPWKGDEPCATIGGLVDAALMRCALGRGERSAVFDSRSKILGDYGDHAISFFYLDAGDEVARVEIPGWVADDEDLLDLVHSVVGDQIQKGDGYPVALTEAHELAVVRGGERESFYRSLEETMVKNDITASFSAKSLRKRQPVV